MRAAVVAFTNCFATDVFTNDVEDASKFHSFADTSADATKYFVNVKSEGEWSVKNENTWHVEKLYLQWYGGDSIAVVSLDVSYNGKDYTVSNLAGKAPSYDDNNSSYSPMSALENASDFPLFFIVPPELIKDDRIDSQVAALDHSSELREATAQRAFEIYGGYLYPYGFECHWFVGLLDAYQTYDGFWHFKVEVTITNQYGASREATAEGVVSTKSVEDFLVY
jgi:hypothetical protein